MKAIGKTIGDRIRQAREAKNLDQATLAMKVGVVTRTLQRWEKGEQVPDSISLTKIAKTTGVHPHWLLTGEGDMYPTAPQTTNIFPLHTNMRQRLTRMNLPLVSAVPAGKLAMNFPPDYVDDYVTVDDIKDPQAFALKVKGNSMAPRIEDGDTVIVSPAQEPRSGDICVVRVNGEDTLKKVKFEGNYVHLIPLNPEFEPMTVKKRDVNFCWKVVKMIKEL